MNYTVLTEYDGYQLLERYGRYYVRFWGGRDDNMPCEFPVSDEDAQRVISDPAVIEELMSRFEKQVVWSASTFHKIGIMEYLRYGCQYTDARAEQTWNKISQYPDIMWDLYMFIMTGDFPQNIAVQVEGYTAKKLCAKTRLKPIGAYNYLIYLREKPQEALAMLQKGFPTKDIEC